MWSTCLALLAGAPAALPGTAHADGDPASDVLALAPVFLPQDGGIPATQRALLTDLVTAATRAGVPVRVAVIATRSDLGSVTALWRRPAAYARFLAQELSQVARGTLLVVMPGGFGVAPIGAPGATRPAALRGTTAAGALRGVAAPGSGAQLGSGAVAGVRRLAAAAGHPLPAPGGGPAPGSRAAAASAPNGTGTIAWLAFALGAILIIGAWGASLRVRPWRRADGVGSPHGS